MVALWSFGPAILPAKPSERDPVNDSTPDRRLRLVRPVVSLGGNGMVLGPTGARSRLGREPSPGFGKHTAPAP